MPRTAPAPKTAPVPAPVKQAAAAVARRPRQAAAAAPASPKPAKPAKPAKAARVAPAGTAPAPATVPAAAAPKSATTPAPKPGKPEKTRLKLVRDSFAMPEADFALIAQLKARAIDGKRPAKKSELLRAGLKALSLLSAAELAAALDALAPVKTGRPKKRA